MNACQEMLQHAKALIESGEEWAICFALGAARRKGIGDWTTGNLLCDYIQSQLGDHAMLTSWLEDQGFHLSLAQRQLCRLAWIDKMIEQAEDPNFFKEQK